jgi:RNA polymerase sigma factor (sigma-70 family)
VNDDFNDKAVLLWKDMLNNSQSAFGELMQGYYVDLFKYGTSLNSDDDLVKDCIQNVFLTIWRTRKSLKPVSLVKFYLLKSLRREVFKEARRGQDENDNNELYYRTVDEVHLSEEDTIINKENLETLSKKIREVMSSLSKRQQEIIYLRYYMDMKPEEIAEIISINKQSVYNLLSDALKRLKSKM